MTLRVIVCSSSDYYTFVIYFAVMSISSAPTNNYVSNIGAESKKAKKVVSAFGSRKT